MERRGPPATDRGTLEPQTLQDSEHRGSVSSGLGVPEGFQNRGACQFGARGAEVARQPQEGVGTSHARRGPWPGPEWSEEELPHPQSARACPLLHPPLGMNHVYKLWKNQDILQKKKKKTTKNIHEKKWNGKPVFLRISGPFAHSFQPSLSTAASRRRCRAGTLNNTTSCPAGRARAWPRITHGPDDLCWGLQASPTRRLRSWGHLPSLAWPVAAEDFVPAS